MLSREDLRLLKEQQKAKEERARLAALEKEQARLDALEKLRQDKRRKRKNALKEEMNKLEPFEPGRLEDPRGSDKESRDALAAVQDEIEEKVGFEVEIDQYRASVVGVGGTNYFMRLKLIGLANFPKRMKNYLKKCLDNFDTYIKDVGRFGEPTSLQLAKFVDGVDEDLCDLLGEERLHDEKYVRDLVTWFKVCKWDFRRHRPMPGKLAPSADLILECFQGMYTHWKAEQALYDAENAMKVARARIHVDYGKRVTLHSLIPPGVIEPDAPIVSFDSTYRGTPWNDEDLIGEQVPMPILLGSTVRLKHLSSQQHLHSYNRRYYHFGSSCLQQVTCYSGRDSEDLFVVVAQNGRRTRVGREIRTGSVVQLRHRNTGKLLACNGRSRAPVSKNFEVFCDDAAESEANWRLECCDREGNLINGALMTGLIIRLVHLNTGLALHSMPLPFSPTLSLLEQKRGRMIEAQMTQREVAAYGGRDSLDFWTFDEVICETLDLNTISAMGFSNPNMEGVVKNLNGKYNIPFVSLDDCHVGDDGMERIASSMFVNSSIRTFEMRRCKIGDYGIKFLKDALMFNRKATDFHLDGNEITDIGCQTIADMLCYNKTVKLIELAQNQISDKGAMAIAQALEINSSLGVLDLNDNQLTDAGGIALARALCKNRGISYVGLFGNDFTEAAQNELRYAMKVRKGFLDIVF
eukprot:g2453.t1